MRVWLTAVSAVALSSMAVLAEEAKPVSITIDNYAALDLDGVLVSGHEIEVVIEGSVEDWTLGAKIEAGLAVDYDAETVKFETPALMLYAKADAFGEVNLWDIDGALGNACVTPTAETAHFDTDDLLSFNTCGGYAGQGILYISPDINGFGFQVSALADIEGLTEADEVDSAVSAALTYNSETDDGVTYAASLAVDMATSVNGWASGADLPVSVQAGLNIGWEGWLLGAAAQYEFNSVTGGDSWGAGIGLGKEVTEQLTVNAGLGLNGYEDGGVAYREFGLGLTAEYAIDDNLSVDGAVNFVHQTDSTGGKADIAAFGVGISYAF